MKSLALASSLVLALSITPCSSLRAGDARLDDDAPPGTLVFVANGSGDQDCVSDALRALTREHHLPLCVRRVGWSRTKVGTLDLHDKAGQKAAAQRLAACVVAHQEADPRTPICLVGHSAGAHVILAAAELLPAGSVDRIVLLAPAVSRHYDLRRALRATCRGIDSFSSKTDCVLLAIDAFCLTADGRKALTAGRLGFEPACPSDPLYQKLRQYPHAPCMKQFGHAGGHYGGTSKAFLLSFVVPLLTEPATVGR